MGHIVLSAALIAVALAAAALGSRSGRLVAARLAAGRAELDVPILMVAGYEHMTPVYATPDAAGCDLMAAIPEPVTLAPGERRGIDTGVRIELPEGYEAQIRPRSGLAVKHGIGMVNAPGTIDHGYRGVVTAILVNHGSEPFVVEPGARIAQMVVAPVTRAAFRPVAALAASERGERGFGSTGTGAVAPRAP